MRILYRIALVLAIIGALNWGSIGIFGYDFVAAIFGEFSTAARILLSVVGVAGLMCVALLFRRRDEEQGHHAV